MTADGGANPSKRRSAVPVVCGGISWTGWKRLYGHGIGLRALSSGRLRGQLNQVSERRLFLQAGEFETLFGGEEAPRLRIILDIQE
jgi:hypothetical protein